MTTSFPFDSSSSVLDNSLESNKRGSRESQSQRGLSQELWSQIGRTRRLDSPLQSSLANELPNLSLTTSDSSVHGGPSGRPPQQEQSFKKELKADENELRQDIHQLRQSGDQNPDLVHQLHQLKNELMQALHDHDPKELKQVSRELDQISSRIGHGGSGSGTGGGDGGSGGGSGSGSGGGDGGSGGGSGSGGGDGGSGGGSGSGGGDGGSGGGSGSGGGDGGSGGNTSGQEGFTATFTSISDMQKYAADGLNFSNIRNLGTGVTWGNSIEKTPGQYDFTSLNKWTSAANSLGKGYIFTIDDPPLADCPNGGQMFGKFTNNGVP
ncbi:MAG TPA: hypothetical protein V6C72_19325, partial [Chroococcales cyanobacterium]